MWACCAVAIFSTAQAPRLRTHNQKIGRCDGEEGGSLGGGAEADRELGQESEARSVHAASSGRAVREGGRGREREGYGGQEVSRRSHDARSHDARSHDARSHDARSHDARSHDARSHDARSHDARSHDACGMAFAAERAACEPADETGRGGSVVGTFRVFPRRVRRWRRARTRKSRRRAAVSRTEIRWSATCSSAGWSGRGRGRIMREFCPTSTGSGSSAVRHWRTWTFIGGRRRSFRAATARRRKL